MMNTIKTDAVNQIESCWNTRLYELLKSKKLTQDGFADELNKTYNTSFTQATVSDWLNVGKTRKKKKKGFPIYSNMVLIAKYFNVDVGYLTGETDTETFTLEKSCDYLNLSPDTIKAITHITGTSKTCIEWGYQSEIFRKILCDFITSAHFVSFIEALYELENTYSNKDKGQQKIDSFIKKIGKEKFKLVSEILDVREGDIGAEKLSQEDINCVKKFEALLDEKYKSDYDFDRDMALYRFAAQEAIMLLINEIYPM